MASAREGRLHRLHRRDWPGFLNRVVPASVWQAFSRRVPRSSDACTRWGATYVVLCWVMMGWSIQGQLTERFREGRDVLGRLFGQRRRPGKRYQGLTEATERLGRSVCHEFWCRLGEPIPQRISTEVG